MPAPAENPAQQSGGHPWDGLEGLTPQGYWDEEGYFLEFGQGDIPYPPWYDQYIEWLKNGKNG